MADDLAHLSRQHALLNRLLAGEVPTLDVIQELLHARVEEDLHLDYKSGAISKKETKKAELGDPIDFDGKLQKYVAGFANSEGGVLIVGVGEPPKKVDGASGREVVDRSKPRPIEPLPWSVEEAERRTREAVGKLAVSLHPAPRIKAVEVGDGSVLVVTAARAEGSVFCLENQQAVYYLRMHDSTRHAPAFLLDDLRLGRRRRPLFEVAPGCTLTPATLPADRPSEMLRLNLTVAPVVTNTGMTWMEQVRVGLALPTHGAGGSAVPEALLPYLDLKAGPPSPRLVWFNQEKGTESPLAPFQVLRTVAENKLLFVDTVANAAIWAGAIVVVCFNQPPVWYQLVVRWRRSERTDRVLLPVGSRRPVVALHEATGAPDVGWAPDLDWVRLVSRGDGVEFELVSAEN